MYLVSLSIVTIIKSYLTLVIRSLNNRSLIIKSYNIIFYSRLGIGIISISP
jgi:hypothetical protein